MAISGKNLVRNVNMPKARRNSAMSVGACKVARASSLRGSGEIPSALTMWPRNLTESVEIVHLSGLRTTPASARAVCTASRVASWISCVGAKDVVHAYDNVGSITKNAALLEHLWSAGDSKRQAVKLEPTEWGQECRQRGGFRIKGYLPEPGGGIEG